MNGLKKRIVGKAIGVVLGMSILIMGIGTPSALAATQSVDRQPGSVTFYKTVGDWNYNIGIPAPYAWRSPATSGQQTVYVQYVVVQLSDNASTTQGWFSRSIPAGAQGVWLPPVSWTASFHGPISDSYVTAMEVRWYSAASDYLGTRRVIYNQNGDYQCNNGNFHYGPCYASDRLTFWF